MGTDGIKRSVAVVFFAVVLAATALYAASQEKERSSSAGSPGGRNPESIAIEPRRIVPEPPVPPPPPSDYHFDVDIWTDRRTYDVGDLVRINFRVTRPCYIYIFDTDTRGVTHQIFPNYFDPDNYVVPGRRYFIPDGNYNLRVVGPPGREELRIVAVRYRAAMFERQHRFTPEDPFPIYAEGSGGFVRDYPREEKRPELDASRQGAPKNEPRSELKKEEVRKREVAAVDSKGSKPAIGGAGSRKETAAERRPETIIIEPAPAPRAVVVEPRPPVYDREVVENTTSFYVVDPYWQPAPEFGSLDVNSQPLGARVVVDGAFRGYTPLLLRHIDPGYHSVEISSPGYAPFATNVQVREGQTSVVSVRLHAQRPRWFLDFNFGL
jgi:hypothetical protein